jgi:pimeloyl-ACP methyl ester carboxylesterase
VFLGLGVPRGDGRLVLVVPGLFGNDVYLQPLHDWLRRIGYRPVRSTLALNAGCPNRLATQVQEALRRRMGGRLGPVAVIGHSRGGMLSWAVASRLQAGVSHLLLLGSPAPAVVAMFRRGDVQPAAVASSPVAAAGQRALQLLDPDCDVPQCGCAYTQDLRAALSPTTAVQSVYSSEDRIVTAAACRLPQGGNVEVTGTHSGLVVNRAAYRAIASFLAAPAPAVG